MSRETFRQEYVRCGKKGCKKCPHGPYWYAYWREGKRLRKRYVGKERPYGETAASRPEVGHRWDEIFDPRTWSLALASEILGFRRTPTLAEARGAYRKLAWESHPDRGGDSTFCRHYNAAWEYVRNHYAWEENERCHTGE